MARRRPEGLPLESVYAAIAAERVRSRLQRSLSEGRISQAEAEEALAAQSVAAASKETEPVPEPSVEAVEPWYGPSALKRLRVLDALLQIAGGGEFMPKAKVAKGLGVSEYLVNRMLREHGIVLPQRPRRAAVPPRAARPTPTKRARVRAALLQLQAQGPLTPQAEVAKTLGVSTALVSSVIRELGITLSRQDRSIVRRRLVNLTKAVEVASQAEAARLLGVSRQRVHQLVRAEGINLKYQPVSVAPKCRKCGRRLGRPNGRSAADGLCRSCRGYGRVAVVCPACGKTRDMELSEHKTRKTDLCWDCGRGRRKPPGFTIGVIV